MTNRIDFLKEKPKILFEIFLEDYSKLFDIDKDKSRNILKSGELFKRLTEEWYKELNNNNLENAYKVYDDDYYFVDIFNCYVNYSRNYIKRIIKSSCFDELQKCESIIDIGCGISYSTSLLKQIFPESRVFAINLENTKQWKFCELMSKEMDFILLNSIDKIEQNVDIVFASEYFEHIYNPTKHIDDIVNKLKPKYMIIANAFNTWSIGHFEKYEYDNTIVEQNIINKLFNKHLINLGYEKMKCKMWNNRPIVWKKI